jgi:hypothetical protein
LKLKDLYKTQTNCLTFDCLIGEAPTELTEPFSYWGDTEEIAPRSQIAKPWDIKPTKTPLTQRPTSKF